MILKGRPIFIYDIEVFPNLFTCTVKNTESGNKRRYEISRRRNDLTELVALFKNKSIYFCGFNNLHYDDPIINFLLIHFDELLYQDWYIICMRIKELSDTIIKSQDDSQFSSWSKYKYARLFLSLDILAMLFSAKLRVGLKEMQVTMQYENVQEYDGDFDEYVPDEEIDEVFDYNENDVDSSECLLNKCISDIELRLAIEEDYGINALNKDGVNLGMEIIKHRYLQKTGQSWSQIKDLRSPCDWLCLGDVIFPFIEFKTPFLQQMLEDLKKEWLNPNKKGFEKHFLLGGLEHTLALGGLHSVNKPETFIPKENEVLIDCDVASMYPSIIIEHGVYPKHLGSAFVEVYSDIKKERMYAKRNKLKLKDATLKLALNGLSGNLQSEFSWCYDPECATRMRLNGQLMLLMLAEDLVEVGAKLVNSNTDGIYYIVDISKMDQVHEIYERWTEKTKLELEEDYFEAMYQFAINDYLVIKKGYSETKDPSLIKTKGLFIDKVSLGKGMAPIIIAEAINKYFADGIPIADTIYGCDDIKKFLTYQKVNKAYSVEYNGELVQRINRYYMSTDGYWLYKCKVDKESGKRSNYIKLSTASGVTILNKFDDRPISERKINYKYYIAEAVKIIGVLEVRQLSLF